MFDIKNEVMMDIIDRRNENDIVIPLYVKAGNNKYSLLDVDKIEFCSPSTFKVGFGTSNSVFGKTSFPTDKLIYFSDVQVNNAYDEDTQVVTQYIMFESSNIEIDNSTLEGEINRYHDMLLDYVMEHVEINRKERIKRTMEEFS